MTDLRIFYCLNDHMIYSEVKPDMCPECSNTFIREVYGVTISKEEKDELSKKS